jgi:hypothetical protein
MDQANYEDQKNKILPRFGFGGIEPLNVALQNKMQTDAESFTLKVQNQSKVEYQLRWDRTDDKFYLNAIRATLVNDQNQKVSHEFGLWRQTGPNDTKMENMLQGRSVYKSYKADDGSTKGFWTRLDLSKKNEKGNFVEIKTWDNDSKFRLAAEISKLPLGMMSVENKNDLMDGIQHGNRELISIMRNGNRERFFIEATPHLQNRLTITNSAGQAVDLIKSNSKMAMVVEDDKKISEGAKKILAGQSEDQGQGQKQGRKAS